MKTKHSPPPDVKKKTPGKDIMEGCKVSPWYSVGKILPTSTKKKEDVFDSYRPRKQCVDYKISETWAKMQAKDVKINIRQITATYEDIPPEICKPRRKKKLKRFSGGPPQWKFIDEVWREEMEEWQKHLMKEHRKAFREAKAQRRHRLKSEHAAVQRLIGPEWFMELSPNQLKAIDQLRQSMYLDLRNNTTENCQDILAALGLVLRPNKKHVAKALQHSCRCPVEFLLVLYQIIDPKRQSYSLNDRLLLSAVVHLSITETLRELHVRIPSPPKIVKQTEKQKKKVTKVAYESPYLEPLTYTPPPPKFTGIYTNKHKQYPESPYFSYLTTFDKERRSSASCFNDSIPPFAEDRKAEIAEYKEAQDFFFGLPGVKEHMLNLLFPSQIQLCPNLLRPRVKPPVNQKLIAPHLCKVTISEPVVCFCEENRQKQNLKFKKVKRSCCEKSAQKFLQTSCLCDACLEDVAQKNVVRIHGGVQKSPCKCDEPVPIIQGTVLNKTCECYREYRDKIVGAAARQYLADQKFRYVVGGVILTKLGPVYNILTTLGEKICICEEIRQRKIQVKHTQETLCNNKAKFSIGGVTVTRIGPVYNLTAVVARPPCKCVLKYRAKLKVLEIQNQVRINPNYFVNHGLVISKQGPVFYFSNYVPQEAKSSSELREVCSCEIRKPKCFQRCLDYVEYKVSTHTPKSSSEDSKSDSEESESESEETSSSDQSSKAETTCIYCGENETGKKKSTRTQRNCSQTQTHSPCQDSSSSGSTGSSITSTDELEASEESKSSSGPETTSTDKTEESAESGNGSDAVKPCRCKDELDRFIKAKCPCDECNNKLRQGTATYVMGGTKTTTSGNQINIVQAVQQPFCGCMHEHLANIRRIDEYKSRVKARYDLKKQPNKYCISGVKNTADGPVYIISGMRPPVNCECAKALREKEEQEEFNKQRAKMPNTGRMKYEIAGVKAMPGENVYILSRALTIPECECAELLAKFEGAHRPCMKKFEKYLEETEKEIKEFNDDLKIQDDRRETMEQKPIDANIEQGLSEAAIVNNEQEIVVEEPVEKYDKSLEIQDQGEQSPDDVLTPPTETKDQQCACAEESSESKDDTSSDESSSYSDVETSLPSSSEMSSSESSSSDNDGSECGSCHVENPPEVKPITIPTDKTLPESFLSKRFAIFREFPKDKKTQMQILQHILKGMADDGFPLAKLPQVYKLPIFKLWLELRSGVYWTYDDRWKYFGRSKDLWKHTLTCYTSPFAERMPFTLDEAEKMTWNHAHLIRRVAAEQLDKYYRKVKQAAVDAGREFFAPTFSYEFPTPTWRDCAFAYLPTKEEDVFAYKIVQPHDTRVIPDNKKMNCYC